MFYNRFKIALGAIAVIISGVIFNSCQKDSNLDNTTKQEQIKEHSLKYLRADFFVSPIDGKTYSLDSEIGWELFERYGGVFWYISSDGVHYYWPNGDVFYRPPYGYTPPKNNGNNNSSYPPTVGTFVQYTLIDIMNAPMEQRRTIVIKNMEEPYHSATSLKAKIKEELLEKVVSGEYIISDVSEDIDVNADETKETCVYKITFSNINTVVEEVMVSFIYEKTMIEPTAFNEE